MPMKEKMRGPPSSCEMATALFDTAAGSGLSFGSSAAFRLDPGKRHKSKRKKSRTRIFAGAAFIAEMIAATRPIESRALALEPRPVAIFAIGVAESRFQDGR